MSRYTWAVDGYGRQFITRCDDPQNEIVMCCQPGAAKLYTYILEDQDAGTSTEWALIVCRVATETEYREGQQ